MSVSVKYNDIALGAKEAFNIETGAYLPASNVNLLNTEGAKLKRYDVPFELNSMILDGGAEFLPENAIADIGFISDRMSGENGDFETPIVIDLTADETFTSSGITIVFDEAKNIYASHLNIKWYNGQTILADADFAPTSANYFCNKKVEFYNRIVISFLALNAPFNRLRVNHIEYGLRTEFAANELRSAKMIQEIDPISTSVPINPFDFTIDSTKDIEFSFQTKQPIEVLFNGEKKATVFVKSAKRKSKTIWDIQSEDYIGLMDSVYFKGGIYSNKNALELLDEIFKAAKVPYSVSGGFDTEVVTGYITYTTCRDALMQVLFAIGAVADTSNSDKVNVFSLSNDVSQTITKRRISQGQNFDNSTRVTAVELASHAYSAIADTTTAYEAEKSGSGENIFVTFSEPLHSLQIQNGSIVESGVNYAVINAGENCTLVGGRYEHTTVIKRKENPLVLSSDIENIMSVEQATLVSSSNVDKLLEICYNYLVNTGQTNMKIIDGAGNRVVPNYYGSTFYGEATYGTMLVRTVTTVGDLIEYETEYLGNKTGRIVKQSFSLVGGMLVKDSIVR